MSKRSSRRWIIVTRRSIDTVGYRGTRRDGVVPSGISLDEWLLHVAADAALERVRLAANENGALRDAHPVRVVDHSTERWLYWMGGEIWATMPDAPMLATVRRVARSLGAHVVDEKDAWLRPSRRGRGGGETPRVRRIVSPRTEGLPSGDPIDRSDRRRGADSSARRLHAREERETTGGESRRERQEREEERDEKDRRERERRGAHGEELEDGSDADADDPSRLDRRVHEDAEALVERQARQVLIVAGTVVCVASVMWLMQA